MSARLLFDLTLLNDQSVLENVDRELAYSNWLRKRLNNKRAKLDNKTRHRDL